MQSRAVLSKESYYEFVDLIVWPTGSMLLAGLSSALDILGRRKVRVWTDRLEATTVVCRRAASLNIIPADVSEVDLPDVLAQHPEHPRRVFEIGGLPPDTDIRLQSAGDEARIRTLPNADGELRLVLGSCFYGFGGTDSESALPSGPGMAYASLLRQPHLKILCGDQVYMDSGSLADDMSREAATFKRYADYMGAYEGFLSNGMTVFSPDDHEFWNDYPNAMPWLSRSWTWSWGEHGRAAILANRAYQTLTNPDADNWFSVDLGLVSLFVTDLRSERSTEGRGRIEWDETDHTWKEAPPGRALCTSAQLQAIEAWAAGLTKPGLIVVGQPLFQKPRSTFDENLLEFPNEAKAIWHAIEQAPRSVVVLSGDIHMARAVSWNPLGPNNVRYEIVGSPMRLLKPLRIGWVTVSGGRKKLKHMDVPPTDPDGFHLRRATRAYATGADTMTTLTLNRRGPNVELNVKVHHARNWAPPAENAAGTPAFCETTYSLQ